MSAAQPSVEAPSLLPALASKGLGAQIDKIVEDLVYENRDNIHLIVDAMIAKRMRTGGKGLKSSNSGAAAGPPASDPKVKPSREDVKRQGAVCSRDTRSKIELFSERLSASATCGESFRAAVAECSAATSAIISQCRSKSTKFFDESFYFDKRENLFPSGTPDDCTVAEPRICERLSVLYQRAKLIRDRITVDDLAQGAVGNCFFIGALSAIASDRPKDIEELFACWDEQAGVYGVMFFKQGGWEWVIVDDFVPITVDRSGGRFPLYASSTADAADVELWPMIVEKAYAKMHYSWDSIDGGWAQEALSDVTGGVDFTLDLKKQRIQFPYFAECVADPFTVMCCSVDEAAAAGDGSATGKAGEAGGAMGLFLGHAYSVVAAKQTTDGTQFVQVRNPWGGDAEWTGKYSDKSPEWSRNPAHAKELQLVAKDDGIFWMLWDDFRKYFGKVEGTRSFPDDFSSLALFAKVQDVATPASSFVLEVKNDALNDVYIIVEQEDPKIKFHDDHSRAKNEPYEAVAFSLGTLKAPPPAGTTDIVSLLRAIKKGPMARVRTAYYSEKLPTGLYGIAVLAKGCTNEVPFSLRVVAHPAISLKFSSLAEGPDRGLSNRAVAVSTGLVTQQQIVPPVPAASRVASTPATTTAADKNLEEAKNYILHLEGVIRRQQDELAALSLRSKPLQRLGLEAASFDMMAAQVFGEIGRGSTNITATQALSGLRLIVTVGSNLDDRFAEACRQLGQGPTLTLPQFCSVSTLAISNWGPLQ